MSRQELIEERLTGSIIGAFYTVYRRLGYGFLEHVYVLALERELRARGHDVARELSVGIMYDGEELCTQRLDMVVDDKVVVETKSTYELHPAAQRQLYNYLRATRLEVGLLFHFSREPRFYRLTHRNGVARGVDGVGRPLRGVRRTASVSLYENETGRYRTRTDEGDDGGRATAFKDY